LAGKQVMLEEGEASHFDADKPHRFEALAGGV
jgi:hypothetical protein